MTPAAKPTNSLAERALRWAKGSTHAEAALLILTEAVNGSLFDRLSHCFADCPDTGRASPDWRAISAATAGMSGGEQRLIDIAVSLASAAHEVSINDVCWGLDERNAAIVVEALAHALQVDIGDIGESGHR